MGGDQAEGQVSDPATRKAGLVTMRKVLQTRLTNVHKKFVETFGDSEVDVSVLQPMVESARCITSELKKLDHALSGLWSADEADQDVLKMVDYDDKYEEIESGYCQACRSKGVSTSSVPALMSLTSPVGPVSGSPLPFSNVKLPKLPLPEFDGSPLKWLQFADRFKASVERNTRITDVDKITYLHGCVVGEAKEAIADFPIAEANYKDAWATLERDFGDPVVLTDAYVRDLQKLPRVRDVHDIAQLRELVTRCASRLRGLKTLAIDVKTLSTMLVPMILSAIPEALAVQFRLKCPTPAEATLDRLMEYLQQQLVVRRGVIRLQSEDSESAGAPKEVSRLVSASKLSSSRSGKFATTSACLATVDKPGVLGNKQPLPCVYCGQQGHWSTGCPQVKTADERQAVLRDQGRCFLCLKTGHQVAACSYSRQACKVCGSRHHVSLCPRHLRTLSSNVVSSTLSVAAPEFVSTHLSTTVVLGTASVWIIGEEGKVQGRCLLDVGSQTSFVLSCTAQRVGAKRLDNYPVTVTPFGATRETSVRTLFELHLQARKGGRIITIRTLGSNRLCGTLPTFTDPAALQQLKDQGIKLADPPVPRGQEHPIDVLLGADCYWQVVTGQSHLLTDSLGLLSTHLGWLVVGRVPEGGSGKEREVSVGHISLDDQVKNFWDLEHEGLLASKPVPDPVSQSLSKDITRDPSGRYIIRLPWNDKSCHLAANWSEAYRQLKGLAKRLHGNPELRIRYHEAVQAYRDLDHAEAVLPNQKPSFPLYYLPHHAVIREDRVTTKVRVVFDASSHAKGALCLNDCLHTGPSLNPECAELLIRCRSYNVPFIADIVKAFLQILLAEQDRDGVRFLWLDPEFWDHPLTDESFKKFLRIFRMKVVIFGANCSPFLLCGTIRHHARMYSEEFPVASRMLDKNLYMDDLMGGGCDVKEAYDRYQQIKGILSAAQMQLSKWATSSPELHSLWKRDKEDVAANDLPLLPDGVTNILGLHWRCLEDSFFFGRKIRPPETDTKRNVLRVTAQLFDPLGFLGPFTIRAKILMQQLWVAGHDWDAPLDEPHVSRWSTWLSELPLAEQLKIPRCLLPEPLGPSSRWELHVFTDASEQAYGAAVYIRVCTSSGVTVRLVASRNRVAPLKKVTLPRLELLGTLAGARLLNYVHQALDLSTKPAGFRFWTDSQIALCWIRADPRRWKTFVANRVQEIQELSSPGDWFFCPGSENPADLLTRGECLADLKTNSRWWYGPPWLAEGVSSWPATQEVLGGTTGEEESKAIVMAIVNTPAPIDVDRFSTLRRLLRTTAWVLRFRPHSAPYDRTLSAEEIDRARRYWIRVTQEEAFPSEIASLRALQPLPRGSPILSLGPFLEDNLLRIRGRIHFSDLPYDTRHPYLLPPGAPFVKLLLADFHIRLFHAGPAEILAGVREKFWVIQGRKACHCGSNACLVCRHLKARPATAPVAPLPPDRVNSEPPFTVVGIDFAGPLYVRGAEDISAKSYLAVFSCAVTRAIHVELVSSLATEPFLLSLRRFFARYGVSHTIYTDNARTFLRAEKELRPVWSLIASSSTQDFLAQRGVTWKHIVERAAWWGGFWERMVRAVKERLRRTFGRCTLNFEELSTVLLEISAALNSRPLCYQSENAQDVTALTPGHFLSCNRPAALPTPAHLPGANSASQLLQGKWRQRCHLQNQFWYRWKKDYVTQLRSFHFSQPAPVTELKVGDLVILHQDHTRRHCWPLAQITAVFPGRGNCARAYEVRTATGACLRRAIQHLCPLEV